MDRDLELFMELFTFMAEEDKSGMDACYHRIAEEFNHGVADRCWNVAIDALGGLRQRGR